MNIWFDLTNSPHVLFFEDIIREIKKEHNVIITCRPLSNTIDLLEQKGFDYDVVGRHYGKNSVKKLLGFPIRIYQLYHNLKKISIDVSISHSSFYSPVVSKILRIPCIYLNDNEHADGNRISFLFADRIMVPEFLSLERIKKKGANISKVMCYPGVKEGIYLWNFNFNKRLLFNNSETRCNKKTIIIRPEPETAQYYKGKKNFIGQLMDDLKSHYFIILLPRSENQRRYYQQEKFKGIHVATNTIPLEDIVSNCDLFIGAGGTMTRESAVLGIPTISVYQDRLLDVDRYLIKKGSMTHNPEINADYVKKYILKTVKNAPNRDLLLKGKKAYKLILNTLLELGKKEN